jgi:hypothetical protein
VLRFVGALRDSVLQGELIVSEDAFVRLFPQQQGYRLFLADAPSVRSIDDARALAGVVERELQPLGVDATVTSERLAAFHQVENTYLSPPGARGLGLRRDRRPCDVVPQRAGAAPRLASAAVGRHAPDDAAIVAEAAFLLGGDGCGRRVRHGRSRPPARPGRPDPRRRPDAALAAVVVPESCRPPSPHARRWEGGS